jgi:hypothetical protein
MSYKFPAFLRIINSTILLKNSYAALKIFIGKFEATVIEMYNYFIIDNL